MSRVLSLFFFVCTSFAAFATNGPRVTISTNGGRAETRELTVSSRERLIVELHGVPAAIGGRAARAANAAAIDRLRNDVQRIERRDRQVAALAEAPAFRREYTTALVGVALEIDRASVDAVRALPYVRRVAPDRRVRALSSPNGPVRAAERIRAASLPTRGRGVVVAVLDTGIDYKHAALGGGFGAGRKVAGGYDFVNDDADPMDDNGHGTHVAGIVAADSAELTGVAPDVTLLAYKVLDDTGSGDMSDVIAGIERAIDPNGDGDTSDRADILNISLGTDGGAPDSADALAAETAVAAGAVVCAAAGNAQFRLTMASPAAAPNVIAVGAAEASGDAASFSSKGPTTVTYAFKPDVIAPGVDIASTKLGGGTVEKSGTSMATPHVAGAAALLLALHPHWTPRQVRSALATTAYVSNPTSGYEIGAGNIDAEAANGADLMLDASGLSFGLVTSTSGTSSTARSITVTNKGSAEKTLAIRARTTRGATIMPSHPSITLAPGASQVLTFTLTFDNADQGAPQEGFLEVGAVRVPWAIFRAARAILRYDRSPTGGYEVYAFGGRGGRPLVRVLDETSAELVTEPGEYLFLLSTFEQPDANQPESALRLVIGPPARVSDEVTVDFRGQTMHTLSMNGVDEQGRVLNTLDRVATRGEFFSHVFINGEHPNGRIAYRATFGSRARLLHISSFTRDYKLTVAESFMNLRDRRVHTIEHGTLTRVDHDRALTSSPSAFVRSTYRAVGPAVGGDVFLCATERMSAACFGEAAAPSDRIDVFLASANARPFAGAALIMGGVATGPLRVAENTTVPVDDAAPSALVRRIAANEVVDLGRGPVYPFCLYGSGCTGAGGLPTGVVGSLDERHLHGSDSGYSTIFDEDGNVVAQTSVTPRTAKPNIGPGYRSRLLLDSFRTDGRAMRGTMEVQFGSDPLDLQAPSMTSLSAVRANGRPHDHVATGEKVTLVFSAGDYDLSPAYKPALRTGSLVSDATRVSYRIHGTPNWIDVPVETTGTDVLPEQEEDYWSRGVKYRADLSEAAARPNVMIDLRFELADRAGNKLTWTQEGALVVGEIEPNGGSRRRSVRH
jgi:subtilisin family serine protease